MNATPAAPQQPALDTAHLGRLQAPGLSDEQLTEIRAAASAEPSAWRPTGQPTGITYTDIFCGFGGSSIGLTNAGLTLTLGANHWDKAILTHALNFPHADHLIADISNYDMRRLPPTDVLWASPICTELSPAGGRPRRQAQLSLLEPQGHVPTAALDRTRATFWDVVRATEVHRYKVVCVENVVEAASWELFDVWLSAMNTLGYTHQFISVSSAHVGDDANPHAPQWRDRLYIFFSALGLPRIDIRPRPLAWCPDCDEINHAVQSWKRPTARRIGKYRTQYTYRCPNTGCRNRIVEPFVRPAATVIDWSDLGQRIGDRSKPLAAATMRRIRVGLQQFAQPFTASIHRDEDRRVPTHSTKIGDGIHCLPFVLGRINPITNTIGAITANAQPQTVVTPPMIVPAGGSWNQHAASVDDPLRTRMTRETDAVCTPQPWITVLRNHADVAPLTAPLAAVATGGGTGGGHQALTIPPGAFIQKHHGGIDYTAIGHMTKSVREPLPGVVARPNLSLVIPYRKGSAKTTGEPLHTVATRDSAALLAAPDTIDINECRFRMLTPREHGRAQRFSDEYRVIGNRSEQTMGFGNAVSANVAQWLGGIIARLLSDAT